MRRIHFFLFWVIAVSGVGSPAVAGSLYPFYDHLQTDDGSFFAVRPFYSHTVTGEGKLCDVLWPLYSRKEFKDEQSSRALMFYFTHRFATDEETPRTRRWLFPFYFQGRDACGENYLALFPLGGTIHEFLGRDKISFALFPLLGKSQINEVKTTSVLWPIYSRTRGEGIRRDRVFPLIGKSTRKGQYEKRFVLWPFWTSADYFQAGHSGYSWILFPICGRANLEQEQTLWLLPPFFRFTKGEMQNRLFCPWPFIQKIESERHNKFYLWPLWGRDGYGGGAKKRTFLLWPFLWSERSEEAHRVKTRRMALPFFLMEREVLRKENVPPEEISRSWKIWPLMSWQREGEETCFRLLELWPVKNSAPVERNWSPLWTVYKRTNSDGLIQKDALWFVWHSERDPAADQSEWSLLKGLLAYKREAGSRSFRILYGLNFGK